MVVDIQVRRCVLEPQPHAGTSSSRRIPNGRPIVIDDQIAIGVECKSAIVLAAGMTACSRKSDSMVVLVISVRLGGHHARQEVDLTRQFT